MMKIKDLIGEIRKFSKDVIDVNDFYRIKKWNQDQLIEYVENYDLNREVIDIFIEFLDSINKRISDPTRKGCIDLQGNFGTGKSHIFLFFSLLLSDNYNNQIRDFVDKKIEEIKNKTFREKLERFKELENQPIDDSDLTGTLFIPIRLTEFRGMEFEKIIELAVTKYILKTPDTLISEIKIIKHFFETKQKDVCNEYLDPEEYDKFKQIYNKIEEGEEVNYNIIINSARKINQALEDAIKRTTAKSEDPLEDICKHKKLGRKYKNIIFLFDELTQWWTDSTENLLKILQGVLGKINQWPVNELYDDKNDLIENNNIMAIFAHQKEIFIGSIGNTVENRFERTLTIKGDYIDSIISKRFFYKDQIKKQEIKRVAEKLYEDLKLLEIPDDIIRKIYLTNLSPKITKIKNIQEKFVANIQSFYPFHPYLFSTIMKQVINKYSTEDRGFLNFVNDCFTKYSTLLEKEEDNLINIDNFFDIFNEMRQLFVNNEDLENIYHRLEKARKKNNPEDIFSEKAIKTLILKYLGAVDPTISEKDLRAIYIMNEKQYKKILDFVEFCIIDENLKDINFNDNYIELTLSRTEPIDIYIQKIKKQINEEHCYKFLKKKHENLKQIIDFLPEQSKNIRQKKLIFFEYNDEIDTLIKIIQDKKNTINPLTGESNQYKLNVLDLIYYFLPPKQKFLSDQFDPKIEIINKIKNENIAFIICKPMKEMIKFSKYNVIRQNISLNILKWIFDNINEIKERNPENLYKEYFQEEKIPVPNYSEISDVIINLSNKNPSIIDNLQMQNDNKLNELTELDNYDLEEWYDNHKCFYKFDEIKEIVYNDSNIKIIENELESFKYPKSIKLSKPIAGTESDKIWDALFKEREEVVKTDSAKYKHLKIGVEDLKLLKLNRTHFSLQEVSKIHPSYKKFENFIDELDNKKEILEFCFKFRINEYGMSIYQSILGLFYFHQKGKIKFYDKNNNALNTRSKSGNKPIFGSTNYFLRKLVDQNGKFGKVEIISPENWEFIINKLISFRDTNIVKFDENYNDGSKIDLITLKESQSLDRERKLFEIIQNHISLENIESLINQITVFLAKLDLENNESVKKKLKLFQLMNMFNQIKELNEIEHLYDFLSNNDKKFSKVLEKYKILRDFSKDKLNKIENIINLCRNLKI